MWWAKRTPLFPYTHEPIYNTCAYLCRFPILRTLSRRRILSKYVPLLQNGSNTLSFIPILQIATDKSHLTPYPPHSYYIPSPYLHPIPFPPISTHASYMPPNPIPPPPPAPLATASACSKSDIFICTSKNLDAHRSMHTPSPLFSSPSRYSVGMHFLRQAFWSLEGTSAPPAFGEREFGRTGKGGWERERTC